MRGDRNPREHVVPASHHADRRRRAIPDAPEDAPAADRSEDALRQVAVAEALSSLSLAHREVLTETIMRKRTVNEAADILGVPLGTVKTRVYYALRALRIVLEERGLTT
jgi:RNA polymerase sigma-70 factor (ECF subfamily)